MCVRTLTAKSPFLFPQTLLPFINSPLKFPCSRPHFQINKAIGMAKSAESEKESRIVLAQADEQVQVIQAQGLAKAIELESEARTKALERMGVGLEKIGGSNAAAFLTADNFVKAFASLAKQSNTVIIPSNAADISGMVTQAMAIYGTVAQGGTMAKNNNNPSTAASR